MLKQSFIPMHFLFVIVMILIVVSCNRNNELANNRHLENKIDSLEEKILSLEKEISKQHNRADTASLPASSVVSKVSQKTVQAPKTSSIITKPKENEGLSGSTYYYYKTLPHKVSVIVTPWINQKRKVIFFNPFGDTTYVCNDVRMSYSITTRINKFYNNGAVNTITINNNPGASKYWTETYITFDINNNPQWKTVTQKPEINLEEGLNNKYWWNAKAKEWVKQEIIKEQEVSR